MLCLVSVTCGVSSPSSHSSNAVVSSDVVVDGVSLMLMAVMVCSLRFVGIVPGKFFFVAVWSSGSAGRRSVREHAGL